MALAAAERYGRWRRRPEGTPHRLDHFAEKAVRAVIERVLPAAIGPLLAAAEDVALILRPGRHRVRRTRSRRAWRTPWRPATTWATRSSPKRSPKDSCTRATSAASCSDIDSRQALEAAVQTLGEKVAAAGSKLDGVLLQREVPAESRRWSE